MRRALLALAIGGLSAGSWACGVCVEDKIAATYDHAVITDAASRGHVVVFAEPRANADAAVVARKLSASASHVRGVDAGTVRTAQSPASFAFALDPRLTTPKKALAAISSQARVPGLQLVLLKVVPGR